MKLPLLTFLVLVCAVCAWAESNSAREFFDAGERAAHAGDSMKAYLFYSRAARMEPTNLMYAAHAHALQNSVAFTRPAVSGPDPAAAAPLAVSSASKTDLANETIEAKMVAAGLADEAAAAVAPPRLEPTPGAQSFELRGDAQTVWTTLAAGFGIHVLFDNAYRPLPAVRADLTDVEMAQAFRALEAATDSFVVPVDPHQILIARDTPANRQQLIPTMTMAVPIPERLTLQEAQEISTAVQQVLEIRRISLDAQKRVVYFRDSTAKALAAREMFETLSRPRAQLQVEIEFLSFSSANTLNYGFSPPSSVLAIPFASAAGTGASNLIPSTTLPAGAGIGTIGGGSSVLALGITDSTLFATLAKSTAQTLIRSNMEMLDGQASTLHVGDNYPVITSSYSGLTGAANASIPPAIQFVDLGLVLKVTPTVHEDSEVTLDVDASFKTLGSVVLNGIPEIDSQQFQGKVRLKDGEWAVMAGLVTASDAPTTTGIAGLAQIPVLGNLFSQKTRETDLSDTLIVLKPHLVYLAPWETLTRPLWTGTESRPITAF